MKIAIPSSDKKMVDERFGRTRYLAIYDDEKKSFTFIDNEINLNATQGAGIQSATTLTNNNVNVVISPSLGPKAFEVLKAADVKIYLLIKKESTLQEVVDSYTHGELEIMGKFTR